MAARIGVDSFWIEFQQEEVEQSIPDRFQQQVERYAEKVAIKTLEYELTYDALNRAANHIAEAIIVQCGQQKEMPIGLCLGNDETMVMAFLGVLKAGKISVLMDTNQPPDRLRYILEDSGPDLIITNTQNLSLVKDLNPSSQVLNVDEIDRSFSASNASLFISPDDLACIIYTSGSTGHPKGTIYNHRCLLHLVQRYTNTLQIRPDDRMLLISSAGHLAGINTILRALLNGATALPFDIQEQGIAQLVNWLKTEKITLYNSVPTVFRNFVATLSDKDVFPSLRIILLGGELVTRRDVDLFKKYFSSNCILINNVGCTELSGYRQYIVDHDTNIHDNILPVGYAVEGTAVVLIDEAGRNVGFNRIGEILLKSRYLALGYWRKPALTAEKFLSSPDGEAERLFRTGDLGIMLPDGCLIHLGRKDSQLRINDCRMQVAEIEMFLLEHCQVKEAAVVVKDGKFNDKQLIAYVVPCQENLESSNAVQAGQNDLQTFLKKELHECMVSSIVFLDSLPLQPSGKIDRHALTVLTQIEQR